jgi:signal transduction histidine kinase/ActR/RegA family two-component response regulator
MTMALSLRRPLVEGTLVAGVLLAVGLLASVGLWKSAAESLQTQLTDEMARLATVASGVVDPELHKQFTDPAQMESEDYARAIAPLIQFKRNAPGVKYVYTAVRDGATVRFILDETAKGDHDGDGREDKAVIGEVYDDAEEALHRALGLNGEEGVAGASPEPYTDEWGTFVTGYGPVRDARGAVVAVVGVDMTADSYLERLGAARRRALYGLVPAGAASVLLGLAVFAIRRHSLRLKRAERFASTELKRTVEELAGRNRELDVLRRKAEDAVHAKTNFLANMSHEIRTPLTAVLGYIDILEESLSEDTSDRRAVRLEHVRTIRNAGNHLHSLINDILDLSKIEAGRMTLETVPTDVARIMAETDGMLRCAAVAKGITLTFALGTPIPREIISDPTRLRQVLINLVGNAVKFTVQGEVRATARVTDGHLEIDVEDTGLGMSEAQMIELFRPFMQVDASVTRRYGGTGLGLSICRRLAEMLGGAVELVRSDLGKGSLFRLTLPMRVVSDSEMVCEIEPASSIALGDTSSLIAYERVATPPAALQGRILLAEDGSDNQRLITHHLRRAGAEVTIADNGVEALRLLQRAESAGVPFDLLLTDVQMPEMDGCTLARAVRSSHSMLPIIALTAHSMPEDRQRCEEAGCDDYATKPVDRMKLIQVCAKWLKRRSAA